MAVETTTREGKRVYVLSEADVDLVPSGERLRAYCPIHGSDHQRSLSVDATTGWGYCHACGATVFIEEFDEDIAATLQRGGENWHGPPVADVLPASFPRSAFPRSSSSLLPRLPNPPSPRPAHPDPPPWQQAERAALQATWPAMRRALAEDRRAAAYLAERAVPPEIALQAGLAYLAPALLRNAPLADEQRAALRRWQERVIFPLWSPEGTGYIGRSLARWQPGMDENRHKDVLEQAGIRRWIKTNPAGWYGLHPSRYGSTLILVEGGFDRLALLSAGLPPESVVALVGTAARPSWLIQHAPQVWRVVLALDGDEGGQAAMARLADEFMQVGLAVSLCPPSSYDGQGKDWSERVRRLGPQVAWPLLRILAP